LLPAFKGLDTHGRAARRRGQDPRLHRSSRASRARRRPIIAQAAVPVLDDDDETSLAARVLEVEHVVYPLALRWIAEGRIRVEDGARGSPAARSPDP